MSFYLIYLYGYLLSASQSDTYKTGVGYEDTYLS